MQKQGPTPVVDPSAAEADADVIRAFPLLVDRLASAQAIPAELVGLMRVDLPMRGRRQRMQALPFALEDRLSRPIAELHCALLADSGSDALAAIIDRSLMHTDAALLPEPLAIPVPLVPSEATGAWAVWREGARAVVRAADGTGFAVGAAQLPLIWAMAGKPALSRLAEALPDGLPAKDLSDAPPPPDAADLRADLRQGAFAPRADQWEPALRVAGIAVLAGLLLHLGLAVADRAALAQIAERETLVADAALTQRAQGLSMSMGLTPVLNRLAPSAAAAPGSDFLPLLSDSASALLTTAPQVSVQRLTWDTRGGLGLEVSASSLEELQVVERALADVGLEVTAGAATASDGAARVDLRVAR